LVDKVALHLARIMSVLDRNAGLDHVSETEDDAIRSVFVNMVSVVDLDVPDDGATHFK
jgi:hypothetical protein